MQVEEETRRFFKRHGSKATALVTRDGDIMRTVLHGHAENVSAGGFTLFLPTELAVAEQLLVELENPVQRVKVRCRASVKHVEPLETGGSRIGCSVARQLSAREVQMLRSNLTEAF